MSGRTALRLTWLLCLISLSPILQATGSAHDAKSDFDVSTHRCRDERGLGSADHEAALDRLDGKRIVFIGDVTFRYQYLELAYYLSYGRCPDPDDGPFILDQGAFDSFNEFYKVSSQVLNIRRTSLRSREVCMCVRLSLEPGEIEEQRMYVFEDDKGRKVELIYEQYFKEAYANLETIVKAAQSVHPTDILINFGYWQRTTVISCGSGEGDAKDCPGLQWLCGVLVHKKPGHKVWWLTVPPTSWNGAAVDTVPWGHHLNIARRCYLPNDQVLDRGQLLRSMENNNTKLMGLWIGTNTTDLSPDAYHAFNRQLLGRVTPEQRNRSEPSWFNWLHSD